MTFTASATGSTVRNSFWVASSGRLGSTRAVRDRLNQRVQESELLANDLLDVVQEPVRRDPSWARGTVASFASESDIAGNGHGIREYFALHRPSLRLLLPGGSSCEVAR